MAAGIPEAPRRGDYPMLARLKLLIVRSLLW
jgi:hypothetical protein